MDADDEIPATSNGEKKLSTSQRREDMFELDECIETLGGRLTDLEFFARRLKTGQTPGRAVAEIIDQSASEILKMYLLTLGKTDLKWSTEQAWYLSEYSLLPITREKKPTNCISTSQISCEQ